MNANTISSLDTLEIYVITMNNRGCKAFYSGSNESDVISFICHVVGLMTDDLLNNADAIKLLCGLHPVAFRYASERLRDNEEVCLAALYSKPLFGRDWKNREPVLQFASDRLRSNEEILSSALKYDIGLSSVKISKSIMENGDFFLRNAKRMEGVNNWLSESLSNSAEFMRRLIARGGPPALIGDHLSKNKEFIYEIIASDPLILKKFKRSIFDYEDIVHLHRLSPDSITIRRIIEEIGGLHEDETFRELARSDAEYIKYTRQSIQYSINQGCCLSGVVVGVEWAYDDLEFLKRIFSLNGRAYFTLHTLEFGSEGGIDFATYKELVAIAIRDEKLTSEELSLIQQDLMNRFKLDAEIKHLIEGVSSLIASRSSNQPVTKTIPVESRPVFAPESSVPDNAAEPSDILDARKYFNKPIYDITSPPRRHWKLEGIDMEVKPLSPITEKRPSSLFPITLPPQLVSFGRLFFTPLRHVGWYFVLYSLYAGGALISGKSYLASVSVFFAALFYVLIHYGDSVDAVDRFICAMTIYIAIPTFVVIDYHVNGGFATAVLLSPLIIISDFL